MRWKLSLILLLLLFALRVICKKMTIRFLEMNSTTNPEYMKQRSMVIKPDRESVDMDLTVTRDLDKNLRSFISVSGHLRNQKNATPEFQFDLPICDIINNGMKAKSQIITNSIRNLFKQGNVPAKCPIKAGNYSWRGLRPRKEQMPTFTLGGVFRMLVRFYSKHDMHDVHSRKEFVDKTGKVTVQATVVSFTLV